MILALKTDQPEAEVVLLKNEKTIVAHLWKAHRELSNTLLIVIEEQLKKAGYTLQDLTGIIVYRGPGSFTGLRIGITTANALAYSLGIPVVGPTTDEWQQKGLQLLKDNTIDGFVQPLYGSAPNITQPRK